MFFKRPKILIFGNGTVGRAVAKSIVRHHMVSINDPSYPSLSPKEFNATAAIICVNADTQDDGSIDTTNIEDVLATIETNIGKIPIMVKTTLTPDLMHILPEHAIYSPEFLKQKNAYMDFEKQPFMLLGGNKKANKYWRQVFKYLKTTFVETTPEAASWTKYLHNAYLASKVSWFHEMAERAIAIGDRHNYSNALDIIYLYDDAIGSSHLNAPNTEGTYGYAGHCFPKDMKAFQHYLNSDLLRKIMEHNNEQRNRTPK